jgi:Arc/MetJ-type ribon-helix-helix transcriptional regulator
LYTIFQRTPKVDFMTDTVVTLKLNQQQLELMDRTIAQGVATDRVSLVRLALREYAAARKAEAGKEPA